MANLRQCWFRGVLFGRLVEIKRRFRIKFGDEWKFEVISRYLTRLKMLGDDSKFLREIELKLELKSLFDGSKIHANLRDTRPIRLVRIGR